MEKIPENTNEDDFVHVFHGSPQDVDELLPPEQTGNIRSGEEERRGFRDVIFTTDNFDKAREYAGPEGIIYQTKVKKEDLVFYKDVAAEELTPKKLKTVDDDIYTAKPKDITLLAKWKLAKRKRGEKQKYNFKYIDNEDEERQAA